jgi:hypothetical protein
MRGEVFTSRKSYSSDLVLAERCEFIRIRERDKPGGAVTSTGGLDFFNCHFDGCEASRGGAFSCAGPARAEFTTVSSCSALNAGAVNVEAEGAHDVDVLSTLFLSNRAELFGSMYRQSLGFFRIIGSNFTLSHASHCVGCLEAHSGSLEFCFSIVAASSALEHNGAVCTREFVRVAVRFCLFEKCAHASNENDAGAVFLMYGNPYDSEITNCAFVGNVYNGSHTVAVASGHTLVVLDCCFSGVEWRELGDRNIVTDRCAFQQADCPTAVTSRAGRAAGFDQNWNTTAARRPKTSPAPAAKRHSSGAFVGCIAAATVGTVLLAVVAVSLQGRQPQQKLPKAFE